MPEISIDLIGTTLVALVSVPAIVLALWKLRELRRIEWLRGRMTSHRSGFGGPMTDSDIDVLSADGAQ